MDELQKQLSDNTDFTVIGVLGQQGVGKSTIMSLIAGASWRDNSVAPAVPNGDLHELHEPVFAPQSIDNLLNAAHQTSGIDLRITSERLLVLDTQPLLSPSVLQDMMRREPQVS